MAVSNSQVTVGTTATSLFADSGSIYGSQVRVKNKGAAVVFLGDSGVTTGNGFELGVGEILTIDLGSGESLFGIVTTGTQPVHVLVTRN